MRPLPVPRRRLRDLAARKFHLHARRFEASENAFPINFEADRFSGKFFRERFFDAVSRAEHFSVDFGNDVAILDSRLFGRRAGSYRRKAFPARNERSGYFRNSRRLGRFGGKRGVTDSKERAFDRAGFDNGIHDSVDDFPRNRNGEPDTVGTLGYGRIDSGDPSGKIDERAAGISRVDGRVGLYESREAFALPRARIGFYRPSETGDDAESHRVLKFGERVSNSHYERTDGKVRNSRNGGNGNGGIVRLSVFSERADDREVRGRIESEHLSVELLPVR